MLLDIHLVAEKKISDPWFLKVAKKPLDITIYSETAIHIQVNENLSEKMRSNRHRG